MSNASVSVFSCPSPFLDESNYPSTGGYILGRLCAKLPGTNNTSCCVPCPQAQWLYPDNFNSITTIPGYISIASLALAVLMLLAYALLPIEMTKRHYLNTDFIIAIAILQLGLAIPVLAKPEQCKNEITPNGQGDSLMCAWSGALLVFGGCAGPMWIASRVLSMHLLICWNIKPTRLFFWGSQLLGWGVPILITTVCLSITGVSFRFGDYCHVNNYKGLQTLWGPLLAAAVFTITLQLTTFLYCIKVYLQSLFMEDKMPTYASEPSSHPSMDRKQTAHAIYRRVRTVLSLQWRSLVISFLVLMDVLYLAGIFLDLDERYKRIVNDVELVIPWVTCLITKSKNDCLQYTTPYRPSEGAVLVILFLLSIIGIEAAVLLGRIEFITGWWTVFREWRDKRSSQHQEDFPDDDSTRHVLVSRGKTISRPQPIEKYPMVTVSTTSNSGVASPYTDLSSPSSTLKSPDTVWTPSNVLRHGPQTYLDASPAVRPVSPRQTFLDERADTLTELPIAEMDEENQAGADATRSGWDVDSRSPNPRSRLRLDDRR